MVKAGECPQQYVPYTESGITPQESPLLPRHLCNLCLKIRCCQTRCLDFVSNEGLRMVFDDDNIPRSRWNFPNNWQGMKGFQCPQREKIARKFYRAGIVPPSGVGLDHPTWKEVRFDHILMILVCHCISLIAHLIFSLLFRYTVDKWFFDMLLFFSRLFGFTLQNIEIIFVVLHLFGLHGLDKTSRYPILC